MTPSAQTPGSPPAVLRGLRALTWAPTVQLGFAFLLGAFAILLVQYAWQRWGTASRPTVLADAATTRLSHRLDVNQAGPAELQQLPGVGPTLAQRIADHRQQHGPYASVDELQEVHGIGPTKLGHLRPYLYATNTSARTDTGSPARHPTTSRKALPAQPIDLNRAGPKELMQLPGIGPVMADRILADRTVNGPYRKVADITRIKGIKGKTLEKLRPYVHVEDEKPAVVGLKGG